MTPSRLGLLPSVLCLLLDHLTNMTLDGLLSLHRDILDDRRAVEQCRRLLERRV